jgi:hypothetical protein
MRILTVLLGSLLLLAFVSADAQIARPSDKEVEKLIAQTGESAEQFERALDRDLKRSTIRGPNGEVNIENFLKDFKTNLERLEERFTAKYAASSELVVVTRGAESIDKFMASQPPSLKGRSEWDVFKASLKSLTAAYGASFPVAEGNPPRRMNDLEIQQAADNAVKSAGNLKKALPTVYGKEDKTGIKTAQTQIDAMTKAAKGLKARVDDGKPASGEAAVFAESVKQVRSTIGERALSADAKTANDGITASLSKVEQAFGMDTPSVAPANAVTPAADPAAAATPAPQPAFTP